VRAGVACFRPDGQLTIDKAAKIPGIIAWAAGESDTMATIHESLSTMRSGHMTAAKLFEGEEKPIWVQNQTNILWSLGIENGSSDPIPFRVPPNADPMLATDEVPFEILKKSGEFKKLLAKMKNGAPAVKILSSEEVEAYYVAKARATGAKDSMDAYMQARAALAAVISLPSDNKGPSGFKDENGNYRFPTPESIKTLEDIEAGRARLPEARAAKPGPDPVRPLDGGTVSAPAVSPASGGRPAVPSQEHIQKLIATVGQPNQVVAQIDAPLPVDETGLPEVPMVVGVRPRIPVLCSQISPALTIDKQLGGDAFVREIVQMPNLTRQELQFIADNGRFVSIISWAKNKLKAFEPEEDPYAGLIEQLEQGAPAETVDAPSAA